MSELTVCVPVYNAEKYLPESIGSILSQTFSDFRLLCYDDGSTDGSLDVLRSFRDNRIEIIEGRENRGGIYARAQLINKIDTKYCAWLDNDDTFCRSNAFEEMLDAAKSGDYDFVNFVRILDAYSNGTEKVREPILYGDFSYCGTQLFEKFYPTDNHFIFYSKMFRTELLKKCIPSDDILRQRFCTDDMFFSAMWFFHSRRFLNVASNEPFIRYRADIGAWGSHLQDVSPQRIGELCKVQYHELLSLYNRMVSERPISKAELNSLINGVNFPMIAKMIMVARKTHGDAYADGLMRIWHSAFGADGEHLLNGIDTFVAPEYIRSLESRMK